MCRAVITLNMGLDKDEIHINPNEIVVITGKEYSFTIILKNGMNIQIESTSLSKDAFLDIWRKCG